MTTFQEQIQREREKKYEKLDKMTREEIIEYHREAARMVDEYAKTHDVEVITIKANNKKNGGK